MTKRILQLGLVCLLMVSVSSCSKFRKLLRKGQWKDKYEAAIRYYEVKDYFRAGLLLEDILPIIRGTEEAELGNFYYAYCQFHQRQYILSAHHFKTFSTIYGRSEYLMEATFMHAYSLYKQSPKHSLDQTSTFEAVTALQNFINTYPYSEYAEQADNLIDELQVKLEKKAYDNAILYYKIKGVKGYRPALVTFENFQRNFPDSKFNEEIAFLMVETNYNYARNSIYSKQEERFKETVEKYEAMLRRYPESKYLKDAGEYYQESLEELSKFAAQKNKS
ncbi:MAG: outer membrane protein assembly factor BamD [Cytophagales bacterium]|nr:outer membrane protein assembly factor BamD [Cytophagales bacterium]